MLELGTEGFHGAAVDRFARLGPASVVDVVGMRTGVFDPALERGSRVGFGKRRRLQEFFQATDDALGVSVAQLSEQRFGPTGG